VALRRPICFGLLGRRPPWSMVTVLKMQCSGWFLDVCCHITTFEVCWWGGKCLHVYFICHIGHTCKSPATSNLSWPALTARPAGRPHTSKSVTMLKMMCSCDFRIWVVTWLHLRRANWVGNVRRWVPRVVTLRRQIYLGLRDWRPPSERMIVLTKTLSGWFSDVGGHVTTPKGGKWGWKCL